jgi:hypothetical protein
MANHFGYSLFIHWPAMNVTKLLLLSSPLATWGFLYLTFRFGGLTLPKLLPWVKFLSIAGLVAWGLLLAMDSPYADAHMGVLYALWIAVWWLERRRSKVQV